MNIESAKLIYFSPTGTTRRIVEAVALGAEIADIERVDLTPPNARTRTVGIHDRPTIIGSPVYAGRLPSAMVARFRQVRARNAPAVIVVVYGNRAYDDALLELKDLVLEAGFEPVAAAAFIGEHSFSTDAAPIAVGRPDADDLGKAAEFGKMITDKMRIVPSVDAAVPLRVPGKFPYKPGSAISGISPITRQSECTACEACALACPAGAITVKGTVLTDSNACIRCCACVKACSTGARVMEEPRLRQIADQLSINCRQRKEPELYL